MTPKPPTVDQRPSSGVTKHIGPKIFESKIFFAVSITLK